MKQYENLDADQLALILDDLDKNRLLLREEARYVKHLLEKKLAQKELARLSEKHSKDTATLRAKAGVVETGIVAENSKS